MSYFKILYFLGSIFFCFLDFKKLLAPVFLILLILLVVNFVKIQS